MTKDDRLIDTTEAAKILYAKPQTLHVWRHQGKGPTYLKIGRLVRYRMSDLVAFMEKNTRHSTSE